MIDFTNCLVNRFRAYGGANGNKINITYQGHSYMLKFPPKPSRNRDMSYSNGCISEYVACHIFEMLGFRTQETLLGNYTDSRSKTKLVVACRDFTEDGKRLIEFAHLKNTCIKHTFFYFRPYSLIWNLSHWSIGSPHVLSASTSTMP